MDIQIVRRQVDDLFRANKTRKFTMEEISAKVGVPVANLAAILDFAERCPFSACQSFDTQQTEQSPNADGFQVHHCNRCNRNFHMQRREEDGELMYVGWYGE
jgi:hypothetical protein